MCYIGWCLFVLASWVLIVLDDLVLLIAVCVLVGGAWLDLFCVWFS